MSDRPLPYRLLRRGIRAASKAADAAVDRAMKRPVGDGQGGIIQRLRRQPASTEPVLVRLEGVGDFEVCPGTTVLDLARANDIDISHYCGGNCSCGSCRIEVLDGAGALSAMQGMEAMVLGEAAKKRGDRLACQTRVNGPATLRIPEWF